MSFYLKDDSPKVSFPLPSGEEGRCEGTPACDDTIIIKIKPKYRTGMQVLERVLRRQSLSEEEILRCLSAKALSMDIESIPLTPESKDILRSPTPVRWNAFFEGNGVYFPLVGENGAFVPLTPVEATLYKYFLIHPQGLRLDDIWEKFDELCLIYRDLRDPCGIMTISVAPVDMLCEDSHTTYHTALSRIRRKISAVLPAQEVQRYAPFLDREGLYRIKGAHYIYWA